MYFQKEFAKELKRQKNPPKEKKDIYDKFAEGDINLNEFLLVMEEKKITKKNGTKKITRTLVASKSK